MFEFLLSNPSGTTVDQVSDGGSVVHTVHGQRLGMHAHRSR